MGELRGLGDLVAKGTDFLGFKQKPGCGCAKRQEWLNKKLPFSRNGRYPHIWVPKQYASPYGYLSPYRVNYISAGSSGGTVTGQSGPNLTAPNCGCNNDLTNHIPNGTNWTNFLPPAQGGTYQDTELCASACLVKRLTNAPGDGVTHLHYYATLEPISLSDTKIIDSGPPRIIDFSGNTVVPPANLPARNNTRFLWDRQSDMRFWSTNNNVLQLCTVSSNVGPSATVSCTANHTFSEYAGYIVNFMDETDQTPDGWLAMVGQNTAGGTIDVFMFLPDYAGGSNFTKAPIFTTPCSADINGPNNGCLHKLIATPQDGVAISGSAVGGTSYALWESPWSGLQSITNVGHFDSLKDLTGKEIMSSEDCGAPTNFNPCILSLGSGDFNAISQLFGGTTAPRPGWHISTRDWPARAWITYSAQLAPSTAEVFNVGGNGYTAPSSSNWGVFQNEIVLVRVDNANGTTNLYRLAWSHARTNTSPDFWHDPRAAISWSGKYILFSSASAFANTGCGSITDCDDLYLIGPLF